MGKGGEKWRRGACSGYVQLSCPQLALEPHYACLSTSQDSFRERVQGKLSAFKRRVVLAARVPVLAHVGKQSLRFAPEVRPVSDLETLVPVQFVCCQPSKHHPPSSSVSPPQTHGWQLAAMDSHACDSRNRAQTAARARGAENDERGAASAREHRGGQGVLVQNTFESSQTLSDLSPVSTAPASARGLGGRQALNPINPRTSYSRRLEEDVAEGDGDAEAGRSALNKLAEWAAGEGAAGRRHDVSARDRGSDSTPLTHKSVSPARASDAARESVDSDKAIDKAREIARADDPDPDRKEADQLYREAMVLHLYQMHAHACAHKATL